MYEEYIKCEENLGVQCISMCILYSVQANITFSVRSLIEGLASQYWGFVHTQVLCFTFSYISEQQPLTPMGGGNNKGLTLREVYIRLLSQSFRSRLNDTQPNPMG